jgi:hypothetical protein
LVLKAQVGGYDVDRLFMDAGSGINLIYAKTLRDMHISLKFLKPTDCSFHGIVLGSAKYPLGRIALDMCFGNCLNYRREKLEFEVMDWPSKSMFKKSFIINFSVGLGFEINRLSAD